MHRIHPRTAELHAGDLAPAAPHRRQGLVVAPRRLALARVDRQP
jgi:hypothetical protein